MNNGSKNIAMLIVVLNYRAADLAIKCLNSIKGDIERHDNWRVIVVDNASGDGSAERLATAVVQEKWTTWASVLPLDHNGGYAAGNNAGIREGISSYGIPDYVMILNPDTIAQPCALDVLHEFMLQNPRAGIAGSRLEDMNSQPECSAHNLPTPLSELLRSAQIGILARLFRCHVVSPALRNEKHACNWVSGAAMMIRWKVIESIGFMDEGYFLYFDEVDFCRRACAAGWEIVYVPTARIVHIEGASTGIRERTRRRPSYWYDSRRRFFVKSYGVWGLLKADAYWLTGSTIGSLYRFIRRRPDPHPRCHSLDLLWGDIKALFSGKLFRIRSEEIAK